ncbi:hypothetical protein [Crocosphaera sp. Alani8]|uniref:hypothetical protein n=1 Tax=Crocosphaera sp. Alani8 TaxID=3038952 RepID=UPI00313B6C52
MGTAVNSFKSVEIDEQIDRSMEQSYPNYLLELLVPWDLPTEQQLNEQDRENLTKILDNFLRVLERPCHEKELISLDKILVSLEAIEVSALESISTKSHLEDWEITDYDKYFDVRRVESAKPAFSILKGIVSTYHAFLLLYHQNQHLDSHQIELQKQGFIAFAHLIIRVYDLPSEEVYQSE